MAHRRRTSNERLPAPPTELEVMAALEALYEAGGAGGGQGSTAAEVAGQLGIAGAQRHGRGAQGRRSWSGTMSPALRVAPRLRALVQAGLAESWWEERYPQYRRSSVHLYQLTTAGRDKLAAAEAA